MYVCVGGVGGEGREGEGRGGREIVEMKVSIGNEKCCVTQCHDNE